MTYKEKLEVELRNVEQELRSMKIVKDPKGGVILKDGDKNTQDAYIRLVADRLSCLKTLALIETLQEVNNSLIFASTI